MSVFQNLNTLTTSILRNFHLGRASDSDELIYSSGFSGLNKCQFWCFECFVSSSLNLFFCRDLKANTEWVSATGQRPADSFTRPERIKKARPSHLRSHLEQRTLIPAISTKGRLASLLFLNHRGVSTPGKIVSFCSSALGSSETPPQTTAAMLSNPWKLKPSNLGSDAPYSECVWGGGETGTSLTLLTVAPTISQPHLNRFQIQFGFSGSRVAGFFCKFG